MTPLAPIVKFLIVCSGAHQETINKIPVERPKFVSIGAAILLTATLASFSGGYALFFSFKSVLASVIFGVLWGLLIFNLDRYIIISIDKNSSTARQIAMSVPRLIISFVLAVTISKPLELRIFEGSINSRLYEQDTKELLRYDSIVAEKKSRLKIELKKADKQQQDADPILTDYNNNRLSLLKQQSLILNNIRVAKTDTPRVKILTSRLAIINKQINNNDSLIAKRKKLVYSSIEETEILDAGVKRRIYREIFVTDSLYPIQVKEMKEKQSNRDLLIRLKALSDLKSDRTMNTVGDLITLIFILLEMSPVLIKLMAKKGMYETAILRLEKSFYDSVAIATPTPPPVTTPEPENLFNKAVISLRDIGNVNSAEHKPAQRSVMQRGIFPKE